MCDLRTRVAGPEDIGGVLNLPSGPLIPHIVTLRLGLIFRLLRGPFIPNPFGSNLLARVRPSWAFSEHSGPRRIGPRRLTIASRHRSRHEHQYHPEPLQRGPRLFGDDTVRLGGPL